MAAIYYFGCWDGPGHFLWSTDGRTFYRNDPLPPSLHRLDGTLCGDPALADLSRRRSSEPLYWPTERQPQGIARLHHVDGWTVLAWWDRSGDSRGGSNSAFVAEGTLGAGVIATLGAVAFPGIWARVEAAGGLTLPDADAPRK